VLRMKNKQRASVLAFALVLAVVVASLLATATFGSGSGSASEPDAGLAARSDALNKHYGLGRYASPTLGEALNARYGNEWTRLSTAQFVSIVERHGSEATTRPLKRVLADSRNR
jgi:hypothetical protein